MVQKSEWLLNEISIVSYCLLLGKAIILRQFLIEGETKGPTSNCTITQMDL